MKNYAKLLNETAFMGARSASGPLTPGHWSADDVDKSIANISDQDVVARLNAYLKDGLVSTYINPFTFLVRVQNKLAFAGLSFNWETDKYGRTDIYSIFPGSGTPGGAQIPGSSDGRPQTTSPIYFKLQQFGGPYGADTDGEVRKSDGISNKIPGGLVLVVNWSVNRGTWYLNCHIERGAGNKTTLSNARVYEGRNVYSPDDDIVRKVVQRKSLIGNLRGRFHDLMKKHKARVAAGDAAAKAERLRLGLRESKKDKRTDAELRSTWIYSPKAYLTPTGRPAKKTFKVGDKERISKVMPTHKPNLPEDRGLGGRKLLLGDKKPAPDQEKEKRPPAPKSELEKRYNFLNKKDTKDSIRRSFELYRKAIYPK